jgi:hypothetical protein
MAHMTECKGVPSRLWLLIPLGGKVSRGTTPGWNRRSNKFNERRRHERYP